jgi:hypothetical protein
MPEFIDLDSWMPAAAALLRVIVGRETCSSLILIFRDV